jgi:hypothetical protein
MEEITEEAAELVARVAALDIGKASLVSLPPRTQATQVGQRSETWKAKRA